MNMNRISLASLVDDVMSSGLPDPVTAESALRATIGTLGARLMEDERSSLSALLPEQLAIDLDLCAYEGDLGADELYERVGRSSNVPTRIAREHVDVVLRAVGDRIDGELRRRLARALPDALAARLLPSDLGERPPHVPAAQLPSSTLATGRPGSRHPLSEGSPPGGHSQSVARNENPHEETKLSSSHGLTQERLDETLATGRPPRPARPIA